MLGEFNCLHIELSYKNKVKRNCRQSLHVAIRNAKLGMQSLSYVGPSAWNKLPNNLKTATSVNCFKHDIKKYFLKKLGETEADIYSFA